MMKRQYVLLPLAKLILFTCISMFYITCNGQYSLKVDTGQLYQEIVNPTYEIPDNSQFFGNVNTKPDMFFNAFGEKYDLFDNVFIPIKEGYCYFDNGIRSSTLYACKGLFEKRPGQTSVFSFKSDTSTGNRKFIMQWKNMGFENGTDSDYINFQIWLYEKDGRIEFHFGPNKVSKGLYENNANGPTIGLLEMDASFSTIYKQLWLKGDPSTPQLVNDNNIINLDMTPENGTIYNFTPNANKLNPQKHDPQILMYPTPMTDKIHLTLPNNFVGKSITIMNTMGQEFIHLSDIHETMTIDVSSLSPDIYFLFIYDETGAVISYKLLKQ